MFIFENSTPQAINRKCPQFLIRCFDYNFRTKHVTFDYKLFSIICFWVKNQKVDNNKAKCNAQLNTIDMWSCLPMTLPKSLKIILNYKLSNWLTSSTNMWFYIYLNEIKSSTYILNCFKTMDTLHIDMCHIVKHLIGVWNVTISFDMVKLV